MSGIGELVKADGCCPVGTYEHCVSMPINGRLHSVDYCVAGIVAALNAANITTANSCCGHGKMPASIILDDGRQLVIFDSLEETPMELFKKAVE